MKYEQGEICHKKMATAYEFAYYLKKRIDGYGGITLLEDEIKLIIKFLEELQTKRKDLKETQKTLEVYKKALDLACVQLWDVGNFCECEHCPLKNKCETEYCDCEVTAYDMAKYYINKVREE